MPAPIELAIPKLREQLAEWNPKTLEGVRKFYMGFGTPSDREWIAKEFGRGKTLLDGDYRAIEAISAPAHRLVEESADRIMAAILEARVRLFDSGERVLAPYTTQGSPPTSRHGKPGMLESIGAGWEGWGAGVMVLQSDIPRWDEMIAESHQLIAERDKLIHEYIQGL